MAQTTYSVPRIHRRFAFIAEAEVVGHVNRSRISELSVRGCYVDTLNPVAMGTEVVLRVTYGCSTCDFPAKVIYTHAGFGMGVVFGKLNAVQAATLTAWLNELASKSE
jgi:hypothetical protein